MVNLTKAVVIYTTASSTQECVEFPPKQGFETKIGDPIEEPIPTSEGKMVRMTISFVFRIDVTTLPTTAVSTKPAAKRAKPETVATAVTTRSIAVCSVTNRKMGQFINRLRGLCRLQYRKDPMAFLMRLSATVHDYTDELEKAESADNKTAKILIGDPRRFKSGPIRPEQRDNLRQSSATSPESKRSRPGETDNGRGRDEVNGPRTSAPRPIHDRLGPAVHTSNSKGTVTNGKKKRIQMKRTQ
jgi:hypothetical protein